MPHQNFTPKYLGLGHPIPNEPSLKELLTKPASGILGAWSTFGLTDVELLTPFALTYGVYVPRVKASTALLEWPF